MFNSIIDTLSGILDTLKRYFRYVDMGKIDTLSGILDTGSISYKSKYKLGKLFKVIKRLAGRQQYLF